MGNRNVSKVAIYCRLSEEDKNKINKNDESNSIKNQKDLLIEYCTHNNWEIYNIYSDDDYSGGNTNRPDFQRMIKDAENRKFNIIICKSLSRFARDIETSEKYINNLFLKWSIRFIGLIDNIDTDIKGSIKTRQIISLANEWTLLDLSDSIKAVLGNHQRNGKHIGGFALYGYEKDPNEKGHLIIDEEAAAIVREIFRLYINGYGKTAIAKMLNERGTPNPSEYKKLKGLNFKAPKANLISLWQYSSIAGILSNEMYIGNMVQGKSESISYKSKKKKPRPKENWIIVENTHQPTISIEVWNKAQELSKEKAKAFKNGEIGVFAKKVKCMHCGSTLRLSSGRNYRYLKCSTHSICKDACIGSFIAIHTLEKHIIRLINKNIESYLSKDIIVKEVARELDYTKEIKKLESKIKSKEKEINDIQQILNNLYLDKVKGIIAEQEFLNFKESFFNKNEDIFNDIRLIEDNIKELKIKMKTQNEINKFYSNDNHITKLDRNMVVTLIDYIEVAKKNPITKEVNINIHWKF